MQQQSPLPLALSSDQLAHYQQEFKLSYHINYLEVCRQRISLQGLDVLEVGGAMPATVTNNSFTRAATATYIGILKTSKMITLVNMT